MHVCTRYDVADLKEEHKEELTTPCINKQHVYLLYTCSSADCEDKENEMLAHKYPYNIRDF